MTNEERSSAEELEPVTQADLSEDTDKGLPTRDALEVALESLKDDAGSNARVGAVDTDQPASPEPGADAGRDGADAQASETQPPLDPPAEFTKEEAADFRMLSRTQQEAHIVMAMGRGIPVLRNQMHIHIKNPWCDR